MLDFRALLSTLGIVFLAEIGDKTQLTVMLLAAHHRSALSVFLGATLALMLASLVAVALGGVLSRHVPPQYINTGAGLVFILFGALLLSGRF